MANPLKINLAELLSCGSIIDLNLPTVDPDQENEEEIRQINENMAKHEFLKDEESYVPGTEFSVLAKSMTNISDDGKVKKKIIRDGYANKPNEAAFVKIHYCAYNEFEALPYDSTYARNRPNCFHLDNGQVIIGLDLAVSSMHLNEKAMFLIDPDYAYGQLGCLGRVPENSTVLFEVELLEIVDSGAALKFNDLPKDDQTKFEKVFNYCLALCEKGKDMYSGNPRGAIKEYNTAVAKLELCQLEVYEEQEKQQELLFRLYSNLLVCYTKIKEPRKGCLNFNKLMDLTRLTNERLPAKCYYNNAKCLRMLGDFRMARERLTKALNIEPHNPEIATEFILLDQEQQGHANSEKNFAKAFMSASVN